MRPPGARHCARGTGSSPAGGDVGTRGRQRLYSLRKCKASQAAFGCPTLGRAEGQCHTRRQDSDRSRSEHWRRGLGVGTWPDPRSRGNWTPPATSSRPGGMLRGPQGHCARRTTPVLRTRNGRGVWASPTGVGVPDRCGGRPGPTAPAAGLLQVPSWSLYNKDFGERKTGAAGVCKIHLKGH